MAEVKFPFNPNPAAEESTTQEPAQETPVEESKEKPTGYANDPVEQPTSEPEKADEEPKQEAVPETEPEAEPVKEQAEAPELDDDKLLALLQKKGFKGKSIADLTAEPEQPKAKPTSQDEETQKFLDYQERTGRGLKDWQELNKDISKISPIEAAKDRIRKESDGVDLSDQDVNYLLEEELGFDPTDEDLEPKDKAKFKKFYGSHLNSLKTAQQKYNEPIEGFEPQKAEAQSQPENGGKVKLSNGAEVETGTYEQERKKYLADREASLAELGEEKFNLSYDGKDGKKEKSFEYKYTEDDRQSMLSMTEDVGSILSNYQDEAGEFNHNAFNKDLWWTKPENRSKAISAMLGKARNEVIAELTGQRKNLNFDAPTEPQKPTKDKGYANVGEDRPGSGFSVKYAYNPKV